MFWLLSLGLTLQFVLLTFSDRNVFGVPLSVVLQRTGQPLPRSILFAINYLQRTGNPDPVTLLQAAQKKWRYLLPRPLREHCCHLNSKLFILQSEQFLA